MIRLNCFIQVAPESRDEVLASAKALTQISIKEDGCIAYDIFGSETRSDVMMICETWRDEQSLAAHQSTPDFKRYVGCMRSLAKLSTEKFLF